MKKLVLFALLFLPAICLGGTTDYYNLSHYGYVPATTTATGDYYYRGGFHVGYDTSTLSVSGIDTQFDVFTSSIVVSTNVYIRNGVTDNITFYSTGTISALTFIGDGSGLTGVSGSDNLGNHLATTTLDMATFNIDNVGEVTASTANVSVINSAGSISVLASGVTYFADASGSDIRFNSTSAGKYFLWDASNMRIDVPIIRTGEGIPVHLTPISDGDVLIANSLEVQNISYLSDTIFYGPTAGILDVSFFETSGTGGWAFVSRFDLNEIVWGVSDNVGNQVILALDTYQANDFDHTTQTNPTWYIHSEQDPDIDNTQWMSISYSSATDTANFDVGGSSVTWSTVTGFSIPNMLTGTDQADAGASVGEFYVDTNDGFTVKLGQ